MQAAVTRTRGFSLFELVIVIIVISILAGLMLSRLLYYQEMAEKIRMENTVTLLKSALAIRVATLMTQGRSQEIAALAQENPMDWLATKPENYSAQFSATLQPGTWYFDRANHTLVYVLSSSSHFSTDNESKKQVVFKTKLIRSKPENVAKEVENKIETSIENKEINSPVVNVTLELFQPYRWF